MKTGTKACSALMGLLVFASLVEPTQRRGQSELSNAIGWHKNYALILMSNQDTASANKARDYVISQGGQIAIVSPPHVMLGWVSPELAEKLVGSHGIESVSYEPVDPSTFKYKDLQALDALSFFNTVALGGPAQERESAMTVQQGAPLVNDALEVPAGVRSNAANSTAMTGTVAVAVFFVESNGTSDPNLYTWTAADHTTIFNQITSGLSWWSMQAASHGTNVSFMPFDYPPTLQAMQQPYEPILHSSLQDGLWVNAIMANLGFNLGNEFANCDAFLSALRSTQGTDWAYCVFVGYNPVPAPSTFTNGYFAYAYLGGPRTQLLFRNDGWAVSQFGLVLTHETGHIFWACDEYYQPGYGGCTRCDICSNPGPRPTVANGNCAYCNANSVPCMMRSNSFALCSFTPAQIGWLSCTGCPASCASNQTSDPAGMVSLLYRFRDDVLAKTTRGQQYTRQFYQFAPESARILSSDSGLWSRTTAILERYRPAIASLVNRSSAVGRLTDLKTIDDLLKAFAARGSRALQGAIEPVRRDLRDAGVHTEFGVEIVTNHSSATGLAFLSRPGLARAKAGGLALDGLVITDHDNDQLRVLLGNGDGTFKPGHLIPVGHGPSAIAIGDFNNDGATDLVTVNEISHDLSVVTGNGDGTFGASHSIPVGSQPSAVIVGDFNGDHRLDLVVADARDNELRVLKGRGDGTFESGQNLGVGGGATGLATGDFNGDGRLDLVVSSFRAGELVLLLGRGDGTFGHSSSYAAADGEMGVTTAEFDGDGRPEVAVANFTSNDLTILRVAGERGFTVVRRLPLGEGPVALVTGEFIAGRLGIAAANLMSGEVSIWPAVQPSEWKKPQAYSVTAGPASITSGDFNRDGRLDLAILDLDGATLRVLLNNGDGTFRLAK